jgi:hypothetical protein
MDQSFAFTEHLITQQIPNTIPSCSKEDQLHHHWPLLLLLLLLQEV